MNAHNPPSIRHSAIALPARKRPHILKLLRGPIIAGIATTFLFFGAFGGWAATAPLSAGAIASGQVSPDSSRKVVQHLEGGIIRTIHVREGQQVKAGETLVTLESISQEANFDSGVERLNRLYVLRARLEAHLGGQTEMVVPEAVLALDNSEMQTFVTNQLGLFAAQRGAQAQQIEITNRRIDQLNSEISAINAQNAGLETQRVILVDDVAKKTQLLEQQLGTSDSVSTSRRELAQVEANLSANQASIARSGQAIEEARFALVQTQETFRAQMSEELARVNNELAILQQDLQSRGDILRRTEITSPTDGVVLNMRSHTAGGVVRAGEPIMDIVPVDDDMIIVAHLQPRDIELVTVGMEARVLLVPFSTRDHLPLVGTVTQVAADSNRDEITGQFYYEIRVEVPGAELDKQPDLFMQPGMPAEVTVVTGARTMLQYLSEPLMRSIRSAFVYD